METDERKKVVYTGDIPQCPYCKKPTPRTGGGGAVTAAYYPPMYDEEGNNTNPDRNIKTSHWKCITCDKGYTVSGNIADGYYYQKKQNN